jgi:hypothetical protein
MEKGLNRMDLYRWKGIYGCEIEETWGHLSKKVWRAAGALAVM